MPAQCRAAHADAERFARPDVGAAGILRHETVQFLAKQVLYPGVPVGEMDRYASRGNPGQRAGALAQGGVKRRHVFKVMAVAQRPAVGGCEHTVAVDSGREQAARPQRGGAVLDVAHPADRVVNGRVERGDRQRGAVAEHDRRGIEPRTAMPVPGLHGRVGEHQVDVAIAEPVRHPGRGAEYGARVLPQRGDLGAQDRIRAAAGRAVGAAAARAWRSFQRSAPAATGRSARRFERRRTWRASAPTRATAASSSAPNRGPRGCRPRRAPPRRPNPGLRIDTGKSTASP